MVQPSLYEGFGLPVEAVHHFFEIAGVIVRPDHVARFIVNANHSICEWLKDFPQLIVFLCDTAHILPLFHDD